MVRLKVLKHINQTYLITFQFQYGAIEGKSKRLHFIKDFLFQFQYGAIEGFVNQNAVMF